MHRLCLIPYYTSYWRSCISLFNQRFLRHTIKRNAEKKTYKGLTYEYMEYYILTHGTKEEKQKNFAEYNEMILISKCHGKPNPSLYADLAFILSSHRYFCFLGNHLHQRGSIVIVLDDIRIVNGTILFRHIQRRMAEQGLKRKSISSAIHKIFPSEGVPEQMNGSLLNTTPPVVFGNRTAQTVFRHHFTCIIGKEIIVWLTFADLDVFTQNRNHHGAQRRDLRSLVLGVLEINHAILKVKVFVLNQTDCPRSVSAVEKIRRIAASLEPLATQMNAISRGFASFPTKIQRLITSTNGLSGANNGAASSYLNLYAKLKMATAAVHAIGAKIAQFINKSNQYIENVNLFNASMGKYANEAQRYAEKVGDVVGIDPGEWMRNQGVFMTLATGFGVVSDRAYIMSKNLTQLG